MYGNLSRRVIKPQYLRQLGRSVGRSMRGTSFRSAVGSGRRRAASVTRRKKVTLPTKKRSTELIEEADHHKLGQPCVQDENRDKSNTKQATIDESSLTRKEEKEEVKINSTTRTETVEKMKFHDEVEREGNNFEGKQEKGKNERSSSKTSKKKANMSGSEDEYEEWFDIIHHLADHGMKEMKHLQKHLARQEAKNTL